MSKSQLSWLAAVLVLAGVAVITGHPAWGTMTGCVFILLGGAIAAGAARVSERHGEPRGQRIPNDLVTLSAAAIIAVYATGFQRTKSADDEFKAQAARRRVHPPIATVAELPKAEHLSAQSTAQATSIFAMDAPEVRAPVPRQRKDRAQLSTLQVQSIAPASTPLESQRLGPTPAVNDLVSDPPAATAASVPAAAPAVPAVDAATPDLVMPKLHYKDGTYLAWGRCAHGRIQASVVIKNGRIDSATIAQCETAYPCERIDVLPGQVVLKQDPNVDVVTGASDSSYAFLDAVAAAMFRGQRGE